VPRRRASTSQSRVVGLIIALLALAAVAVFSIGVGSRYLPPGEVIAVLLSPDESQASTIVHGLRLPRTILGIVVGIALGMSGAVMQALTRNPLADPGLLGVNAGAAVAVVIGIASSGSAAPSATCRSPSPVLPSPRWWCTSSVRRAAAARLRCDSPWPGSR
jgi:iron complex transport system permease protein